MSDLHRKPDQYYIDRYDRMTIKNLKNLEGQISDESPLSGIWKDIRVNDAGSLSARNREETIARWKFDDERKDRLIQETPVPRNIRCDQCDIEMEFTHHHFRHNDPDLFFIFDCPKGHMPRKLVYSSGKVLAIKKKSCNVCGSSDLVESTNTTKKVMSFITKCKRCKNVSKTSYDLTQEEDILPIDEQDRKKYCLDYKGRRTFNEELVRIGDFYKNYIQKEEEKKLKDEYGVDKIEKLNIPHLEKRLQDIIAKLGFIKLDFGKPEVGKQIVLPFSLQDPSIRSEQESLSMLTTALKKNLFHTNWRLTSRGISYRLGYLTAELKVYESEDDLLKIAKEIGKRKKH